MILYLQWFETDLSNTSLSDVFDPEMKIWSKILGAKKESVLEKVGVCERLHDLFLTLNKYQIGLKNLDFRVQIDWPTVKGEKEGNSQKSELGICTTGLYKKGLCQFVIHCLRHFSFFHPLHPMISWPTLLHN